MTIKDEGPHTRPKRKAARPRTKLDRMTALLKRDRGATLKELVAVTKWQPHSVRGALAGTLKRKGYNISSEKLDGVRRYVIRISPLQRNGDA